MLSEKTDEQLMTDYANNNIDAFQVLYARHKTALYRFLLRQVDKAETAEELFQDTWSKVIKSKETYKPTATFRTYIYQIARNTLVDWFRHKNIRSVEVNESSIEKKQDSEPTNRQNDPAQKLENQQCYSNVIDAIKSLTPEQRDVFLLKEEANLSIKEIAVVTYVKEETAKSRYRYAIKQLKVLLGQRNDE